MTLRILILFLIILTGNVLINGRVPRQYFIPMAKNNIIPLYVSRDVRVIESIQHPYNLFKTRKGLVKLAEQYIKNQKPYNYKQYQPYNPHKKALIFNHDYVNEILSSLGLLQPLQEKPPLQGSTTESIILSVTKNPVVEENATFSNTLSSTTDEFKNNGFEATESSLIETTENFETTSVTSTGMIDLTEISNSENSTTLLPSIEDITTESEFINESTELMAESSISGASIENYEENTEAPTTVKLESMPLTPLIPKPSTGDETTDLNYESATEDIHSFTNLSVFDSDSTTSAIDITTTEGNTITFVIKSKNKTNSISLEYTAQIYDSTLPLSFTTVAYETIDTTTLDSTTVLKTTSEKPNLSLFETLQPSPTSLFQTSTESFKDLLTTSMRSSSQTETSPEEAAELLLAEAVTTENVAGHGQSTTFSEISESILDAATEIFDSTANIPFNDHTTQITETTMANLRSSEAFNELTTLEIPITTSATLVITEPPPIAKESEMVDINADIAINSMFNFQDSKTVLFDSSTVPIQEEATKANAYYSMTEDFRKFTTETISKVSTITELESTAPTSYNFENVQVSDLKEYNHQVNISSNVEKIGRSLVNERPNRKRKTFTYHTDVMPSLGDYDVI